MISDVHEYSRMYKQIYDRDNHPPDGRGWIQWKGTNVCIDLHCVCGVHGHLDEDFLYHAKCRECGRVYALGQTITLIELTEDEIESHVVREPSEFGDREAAER